MGVYLSKACTHINFDKGKGENGIEYIVGDMQGWRKNHEDAHITVPDLAEISSKSASLFGVFDGHGGKEVALFVQDRFTKELINSVAFKEGRYDEALCAAFHRMDELLEDEACESDLETYRKVLNPSDIYDNDANDTASKKETLATAGSRENKMSANEAIELLNKLMSAGASKTVSINLLWICRYFHFISSCLRAIFFIDIFKYQMIKLKLQFFRPEKQKIMMVPKATQQEKQKMKRKI